MLDGAIFPDDSPDLEVSYASHVMRYTIMHASLKEFNLKSFGSNHYI
jgi:hypothetical protein